jgi:hypothetical protein
MLVSALGLDAYAETTRNQYAIHYLFSWSDMGGTLGRLSCIPFRPFCHCSNCSLFVGACSSDRSSTDILRCNTVLAHILEAAGKSIWSVAHPTYLKFH